MYEVREFETRSEMVLECIPKNGIAAEVGVCKGRSAREHFMVATPRKFHLCDIWHSRPENAELNHDDPDLWYDDHEELVRKSFSREIESGQIEIHKSYGGDFLHTLPDNYLDWVYLDSDHSYEAVHIEMTIALNKVKLGGFIMVDDFVTLPRVWKAGPIRAVLEKCNERLIEIKAITIGRFPTILTQRVQ